MRKKLIHLIGLITLNVLHAQTNSWTWAKHSNNNPFQQIYAVVTDPSGNTYMAGSYGNTFTMGSVSNTCTGLFDAFLLKLDPNGNTLWSLFGGGSGSDGFTDLALDKDGNLLATGICQSPSLSLGSFTVQNTSYSAFFLLKLDTSGTIQWLKSSNQGNISPPRIAVNNNHLVLAADFGDEVPLVVSGTTLVSSGMTDIGLLQFDYSGNLLWGSKSGGTNTETVYDVDLHLNGDIYVSGNFASPVLSYGSNTLSGPASTSTSCVYVLKYNSSGAGQWAKKMTPSTFAYSKGLALDASGNVYLGGYFTAPTLVLDSYTLSCSGSNFYIAKLDANGNVLWVKNEGGSQQLTCSDIQVDVNNNVYLGGIYKGSGASIETYTLSNDSSTKNIFISSYNGSGQLLHVRTAGGKYDDELDYMSLDANGYLYAGGYFIGKTSQFGSTLLQNSSNTNGRCIYLARANSLIVGIQETKKESLSLKVFPNPAENLLYLSSTENMDNLHLRVYSIHGAMVLQRAAYNVSDPLDVSGLSAGVYLLVLSHQGIDAIVKFIKQ